MRRRSPRATFAPFGVVAALFIAGAASSAMAGSICGTVRDGQTLQPVASAAVFLFDQTDQYTGLYAGTDIAGHYCIDNKERREHHRKSREEEDILMINMWVLLLHTLLLRAPAFVC